MIDVTIIGAGVSGLSLAWMLQSAGLNICVLEARQRTGGRLWSPTLEGAHVDLGASWVWTHEQHALTLLEQLGLDTFPSAPEGVDLLARHNKVIPIRQPTSWSPERRIKGGAQALTTALYAQLGDIVRLNHRVARVETHPDHLVVHTDAPEQLTTIETRGVAVALPPALCAQTIDIDGLPEDIRIKLSNTPTWMEQFAKIVAVFQTPFWRRRGLSGRAFSDRGLMREIHDISDPLAKDKGVLFGFAPDPIADKTTLLELAKQQLTTLFGPDAQEQLLGIDTHIWSQDSNTVTSRTQPANPTYFGHAFLRQPQCDDRVLFISTETASVHTGHIDGAIHRAQQAAAHFMAAKEQ